MARREGKEQVVKEEVTTVCNCDCIYVSYVMKL